MNPRIIVLGSRRWGCTTKITELRGLRDFECIIDCVESNPDQVPEEVPDSFLISAWCLENVPVHLRNAGAEVIQIMRALECGHLSARPLCPRGCAMPMHVLH